MVVFNFLIDIKNCYKKLPQRGGIDIFFTLIDYYTVTGWQVQIFAVCKKAEIVTVNLFPK